MKGLLVLLQEAEDDNIHLPMAGWACHGIVQSQFKMQLIGGQLADLRRQSNVCLAGCV